MASATDVEHRLETHEAVCAERYQTFIMRVDLLERLLMLAAGTLIMGMASMITAIFIKGL